MSFQTRNDRRDVSRTAGHSNYQEWIPRGSTATPTATTAADNQQSGYNSNSNEDYFNSNLPPNMQHRGQDSFNSYLPPNRQHRGQDSSRGHAIQSNNQIRERGKQEDRRGRGEHEERRGRGRGRGRGRNEEISVNQEDKLIKESNLPQLVQEIQEKLLKGNVECLICYDMVRRSAPIWSCSSCYSIFHLNCIKKWARAPTSVDLSVEKNIGFNWRCPGCQSVQLTTYKEIQYLCFCAKRQDPPSDLYLTPHSCGEPCGKPIERELPGAGNRKEDLCPHVCVLQCHPGPCPPCKAFAPPQLCPCGKKVITTRCADRKSALTCGQHCDKLLDCWRHRCERICHVGSCDTCQVLMNASCFCKKSVEVLLCGDMAVKGEVSPEDGVFACNSYCGKKLSCGNHVCNNICHPGPCGECDLLPGKINTCCCGKISLPEKRQSCLESIPTCENMCGKMLPCGIHGCKEVCHSGDCPPCLVLVTQKCRCGSTSRTVECYKTTGAHDMFLCEKPCGRKKNCGRHRCSEKCCTFSNFNSTHNGDGNSHFCSMSCGKKLRCGQHSCESFCHSGHCPPCLETIFTDLTCACGKTSIPPPQPCGTPPPSCQLPCSVPQPCGHSSSHSCHFGDCPPCSIPIAKECVGGHVLLRNIPCGSKDIRCNKVCGKTRQCGMHSCERTCHPPPCDASSSRAVSGIKVSCGQTCGAPRRDCRHTCSASCHPSASCPDLRCNFTVTISCSCGQMSANVPCDAGGSISSLNADTASLQKLPGLLQPVEANGTKIPLGQRKLLCDDECAKMERKRVLADAFDVTPPNLDALHFGENSSVSEILSDLIRHDSKWVLSVEERCKYLVLAKTNRTTSSLRVHVFSPMPKAKRDALRVIAERWKLVIHAAGWEPKQFIVVHVTPKSKAPTRIISAKGSTPINNLYPPTFDSLMDMDPRLVVSLFDLPSDSDINALVLRFGGECQLVWLNDKNALAVFNDPARASTAMRRLDNGSVYHGAVVLHSGGVATASTGASNAWGGAGSSVNPWKKSAMQQSSSWGGEDWSNGCVDQQASVWKEKDAPIMASVNRWNDLGINKISEELEKHSGTHSAAALEPNVSASSLVGQDVDDWETVCE